MKSSDENSRRVKLGDIAERLGISTAAVSMALRGGSGVSKATVERVQTVASELGYVYDRGAALLRTGQSNTVGIVIGTLTNSFFGELVSGVDEAIGEANKISLLLNTREDADRQKVLLNRMREQSVDGLILCPAPGTDPDLLSAMQSWDIPVIQMLRSISDTQGDFVSADYQTGVETLCAHLVRLGHKRIAFLGGDLDHSATQQRLNGFNEALKRFDLSPDLVFKSANTSRGGREGAAALLETPEPPTALVCFNDRVALGAMAGIRAAGLIPGHDVAVTGFDNIDASAEAFPALTTVETHGREIGREAGRLLLRRISDPNMPSERIIIPTRMIIRQSCGATLTKGEF